MFHSTFPKTDIITDYILNYEAEARTSVTSQVILRAPHPFRSLGIRYLRCALGKHAQKKQHAGIELKGVRLKCLAG